MCTRPREQPCTREFRTWGEFGDRGGWGRCWRALTGYEEVHFPRPHFGSATVVSTPAAGVEMATQPAPKPGDLWLWLAANEEQLLLHSGLMRLADHIPVPSGVAEVADNDPGLPEMDGKSTGDLADIILRECGTKTTTYDSLMEYRRNALRGLWTALRLNEIEQQRTSSSAKEPATSSSSCGASQSNPAPVSAGFASRVSLVLIFPIMKSLSRFDPTLSSEAASGLLECLRVYEPLSLSREPQDCVHGLESLLHSWLASAQRDGEEGEGRIGIRQVQNAASALVALTVAV